MATTPPVIESTTFNNVSKIIPLYVPSESIDLYKNALYWNEFMNITIGESNIDAVKENEDWRVTIPGGTITIIGVSESSMVHIYSINGTLLHSSTIAEMSNINLPHGIYFVQVNNVVKKVVV